MLENLPYMCRAYLVLGMGKGVYRSELAKIGVKLKRRRAEIEGRKKKGRARGMSELVRRLLARSDGGEEQRFNLGRRRGAQDGKM